MKKNIVKNIKMKEKETVAFKLFREELQSEELIAYVSDKLEEILYRDHELQKQFIADPELLEWHVSSPQERFDNKMYTKLVELINKLGVEF